MEAAMLLIGLAFILSAHAAGNRTETIVAVCIGLFLVVCSAFYGKLKDIEERLK